jgi:hypothetical protein
MKILKFFLFVMLALGMSMACSEDETPGQQPDDSHKRDALKGQLGGDILPACTTRTDNLVHYYLTDHKTTILKEFPPYQSGLSSYIVIAKRFDDTEPIAYLIEHSGSGFMS